jgi:hypothetical protein
MLLNNTDLRNVTQTLAVVKQIVSKTQSRYPELNTVVDLLSRTYDGVKTEVDYINKLQKYMMQDGFQLQKYINQERFQSIGEMKSRMDVLFQQCNEMHRLVDEYRQLYQKFDVKKRRDLENLLRFPDRIDEAKTLMEDLKRRIK